MYDEEAMIRNGTADGPVTREMIDRCKAKLSSPADLWMWPDFLPEVRAEMEKEKK